MKRRLCCILLALVIVFSMAVPSLAVNLPTDETGNGMFWADNARVAKGENVLYSIYTVFDTNLYSGLDSFGATLRASASLVSPKGTTSPIGYANVGAANTTFWANGEGKFMGYSGSGGEAAYGITFKFMAVDETTPMSITSVDLFKVIDKTNPDNEIALPVGDVSIDRIGDVIVQVPVDVKIIGTVPAGASVSVNATNYTTASENPTTHTTYNSSGAATAIENGGRFWVDTGANQQNSPNLNIAIPDGYVAQCYTIDTPATPATEDTTQYKTAGEVQTLGTVNTGKTVFVRFMKEYTLQFNANGGTPDPADVKKFESDPDYTITETVTKENMKFDGWYNGDVKVTSWDTNSDLTVTAKFSPLPGADIPSTYKFVITAPDTLLTNQSYTEAKVELSADQINQLGYPGAKLVVEMTAMPAGANPVVTAPVLGNLIGLSSPLPVSKDFTYTLPISELKADKPGTYKMTVSLVDGANGDALICEASHTIIVTDTPITVNTVEFDAAGGTPAPDAQKVINGEKATKPADPTKEGYTFDGWYLANGTKYDFSTPVTANVKLTAKYTEKTEEIPNETTSTVKFDSKGGSAVADQKVKNGEKATKPADPTKNGFTFDGWYLADGTKYDFTAPVTGNLTLEAHWKAVDTNSPNTGDNSNMWLWITLLAVAVLGLCGFGFYGLAKKKGYEVR